jgi:hypothetical protein
VICLDLAGTIPDMIRNKAAARNANQPVLLANYMLTGAIPSD